MKIFRRTTDLIEESDNTDHTISVLCLPDTALLIQKRPFFIPDFTHKCSITLCAAIHINRLGRSINRRYASRYYEMSCVTLAAHFIASDLLAQLRKERKPWDLAIGFDNALAVSGIKESLSGNGETISLCINDRKYGSKIPDYFKEQVDDYIAQISMFYTLRQGDILLYPLILNSAPCVNIDDRIVLRVQNKEVLAFNVK